MIIERVRARRLRAIKEERNIEFFPGLNVIKGGDNEAGKSSLRLAVTIALFQDTTTAQEEVFALTSWGADEPWEIVLEFEAGGQSYRITKSLKDRACELICTGPSEFVATNKNTIADKVAEITGCPSGIFFESTACIGQDELIRIVPMGSNVRDRDYAISTIVQRLQARLSGIEEVSVSGILAKLYSKIYGKETGGIQSHLTELTDRAAHIRSQKLIEDEKVNRIMESRRELYRTREELKVIDRDLPTKQEIFSKNKRILELEREVARDKSQYDTFSRGKETKSRLDSLDEELKQFPFIGAEETIGQLTNIKRRLEDLKKQGAELEDDQKTVKEQKPALWMLLLGVALTVGGLIGLIASQLLFGAAAAGALLSVYWLTSQKTWKERVNSLSLKVGGLENQIRDDEREMERLLTSLGLKEYDQFERQLVDYTSKTETRKDIKNSLDTILAGKDWSSFSLENTELDTQMTVRLKELEQFKPFRLEPLRLQALEGDVRNLQERKESLEREREAFEKFFKLVDMDASHLAEIEEEMEAVEQEKEFWERKRRVFQLTREILEEANKQTLSKAADLLEKELGRYIAIVTDDRYSQVKIDEGDLSIRTFSPEKKDWVDVRELSRATQDQFYICARLALVKLVTEGERPPILLDDPFVNFHPKRLRKMMALLQELSREYQILLFTCSDAYDYLGNIISLD